MLKTFKNIKEDRCMPELEKLSCYILNYPEKYDEWFDVDNFPFQNYDLTKIFINAYPERINEWVKNEVSHSCFLSVMLERHAEHVSIESLHILVFSEVKSIRDFAKKKLREISLIKN